MHSIELQLAYVLHTRPYRDTSMLVDFLTPHYGRVTAVARGVRSRKTPKRNLLNPFSRLLISFQGKTDLKLLTSFEADTAHFSLTEKHLYSGFYLNELIVRLLPELDAHPDIFELYEQSLSRLHQKLSLEPVLRYFEFQLLESLGYAINFMEDVLTGLPIDAEKYYCLDNQQGFYETTAQHSSGQRSSVFFAGSSLLAIAQHHYESDDVRQAAKRITRILLKPLLGNKPLASRELFV